jgi:UDP-N-acetylglucosamine/UDP-N-acetylgalactosamine 4-epimerase
VVFIDDNPVGSASAKNQVYNIAVGDRTSLNQLYGLIKESLSIYGVSVESELKYFDFRAGDVLHSLANIDKAKILLGYAPTHNVGEGIRESMAWYCEVGSKAK